MCFYIHPKHQKAKIAKKRIKVWKVGYKYHGGFVSPVERYAYWRGYQNETVQLMPEWGVVGRGYHSFSSYSVAKNMRGAFYNVYELYIPVGARYYYNPKNKEYVSNKIVFPKIK